MNLNYLPFYSGAVAVISIIVAVVLSRRGWSLVRSSLVLLALGIGLSTVIFLGLILDSTFHLAEHTDHRAVSWLEHIGATVGVAAVGFLVATACVTAFLQTHNRKPKSNVA